MAGPDDLGLLIILVICLYTDLRERKIYNKVVFPAALGGVIIHTAVSGFPGLKLSLAGLALGILLFALPFLCGGIGAGDVKLLAAVGALKGPLFVCGAALGTALAGGLIALIFLLRQGQLMNTLKRLTLALSVFFIGKSRAAPGALLLLEKTPYSAGLPYGAAIFLGTLAAYLPYWGW